MTIFWKFFLTVRRVKCLEVVQYITGVLVQVPWQQNKAVACRHGQPLCDDDLGLHSLLGNRLRPLRLALPTTSRPLALQSVYVPEDGREVRDAELLEQERNPCWESTYNESTQHTLIGLSYCAEKQF